MVARSLTDRRLPVPVPPDPSGPGLPLVEEVSSGLDPWEAFLAIEHMPQPLFMDSSLRHETLGRYSYVTADPFLRMRWRRGRFEGPDPQSGTCQDPLAAVDHWLRSYRQETIPGLPPFQGGIAGLLGYGLCHSLERIPRPRFDEFAFPEMALGAYDWVLAFDHDADRAWLISTGWHAPGRRHAASARLQQIKSLLRRGPVRMEPGQSCSGAAAVPAQALAPQFPLPFADGLTSNFRRHEYLKAVRRAIDYVHAGDCFQVNVSQRLLVPSREPPLALYRRLRERNPAPFSAYLKLSDFVIASASPERFLQLSCNRQVEARPIKGTRPRSSSPAEDRELADELRRSPKDRAENIMIVDLLRNDLGRVCDYGTVRIPQLCQVESYKTVHHLVSVVEGRLRANEEAAGLLRAAFPGGSVTGAPKIRAMEIIAELEPTARGPYCGSIGFIGFDGTMDTSILIRTFTIGRGWVQFPVGGGIVADSLPEEEYEETLHKAAGLLRALA